MQHRQVLRFEYFGSKSYKGDELSADTLHSQSNKLVALESKYFMMFQLLQ